MAAEITTAGADDLQRTLTRYLPDDLVRAGLVTVQAASGFYELRLDPAVLLKKARRGAPAIEGLKPLTAHLRPRDDGAWGVEARDTLDIKGAFDTPAGRNAFSYLVEGMALDGIYDPDILYFRTADWSAKRLDFTSSSPAEKVEAHTGALAMHVETRKQDGGRVDMTGSGMVHAFTQTVESAASGRVDIGAKEVNVSVDLAGGRYKDLQDLIFFILDHVEKDRLDRAEGDRFKDLLRATLPVFDNLEETITATDVTVDTPQGVFGASSVGYAIAMTGATKAARIGIGFAIEDPTPAPGLLPAVYEMALPQRVTFKAAVTDLDLAGAAAYLLDHADFTEQKPLTEAQNRELGRIVLPSGAMTVEFEDVSAVSPIYDLQLAGHMLVYPDQTDRHSADVTLTMRDFDKTVAYLQQNAASVPEFGQVAFGLLMMKGLARESDDGAESWDLQVGEDGKVLINGRPLPFQQ